MSDAVRITGLKEFVRDLKKLDRTLPKAVRLGMNDAVNIVVDEAKPRVPVRTGKARKSIKAKSTTKLARISAGGKRASYYPWLDFGGRVGKNNSVHRPVLKKGRYIYPAYDAKKPQVTQALNDNLFDIARQAGLHPRKGG